MSTDVEWLFNRIPSIFKSHMPFVSFPLDDDKPTALCCLTRDKQWKSHYLDENQVWRPLFPSFGQTWIECNPTMYISPEGEKVCSVVARDLNGTDPFYLYVSRGLGAEPVIAAQTTSGFVMKNSVVYSSGNKIFCYNLSGCRLFAIPDAAHIYRIAYMPEHPYIWLVCGDKLDGSIFSWVIDPNRRALSNVVLANGDPAYKCVIYDGVCVYARREDDGGFEDRRITCTKDFSLQRMDFFPNIAILREDIYKDGNAEDTI